MHDDQRQPAAVAPRLSEDEIRNRVGCLLAGPGRGDCEHFVGLPAVLDATTTDTYGRACGWCMPCWTLYQLDATRADLARTRAEAAALKKALVQFQDRQGHFNFNATPCDANWFGSEKNAKCSPWCKKSRKALAAPQSEQPAAPVDRSAAAEGSARSVCCHCDGKGLEHDGSICMNCNGTCCSYHYRAPKPNCRFCKHATTPPDHQAGDGDD